MTRHHEVMGRNQTFIVSPPEKALTQVRIHWLLQLVTVNKNQGFDFSLLDQLLDQVTEGGISIGNSLVSAVYVDKCHSCGDMA